MTVSSGCHERPVPWEVPLLDGAFREERILLVPLDDELAEEDDLLILAPEWGRVRAGVVRPALAP